MFRIRELWFHKKWEANLRLAHLLDIESVAHRDLDWFEAPNKRRGGWSGVSRLVLNPDATKAEQTAVFLKIQQNHFYRSWRNCFRKRLTYEREFLAINHLDGLVKGLPKVLLYAQWQEGKNKGCLFVTEALDEWIPLNKWLSQEPENQQTEQVLQKLAETLRSMHRHQWAHFGLFQKHVFLRPAVETKDYAIKLIDFEKSRKTLTQGQSIIEDVSRFLRHSPNLSQQNKIYFLKAYFQTELFSPSQKALIRKMRGAPEL